jgi:hypothetical protein
VGLDVAEHVKVRVAEATPGGLIHLGLNHHQS